ncbi:kinase-like domain-containing protein [Roridomyces roridus]|uniref:Kinase-like domain-containing protein n=1 Tax=Roridomyces roridus TaxID=1738132 RepID=A0AAD7BE45_9AGAR|nr:kinase-like domain-containing protein [Roridomyces roridus]
MSKLEVSEAEKESRKFDSRLQSQIYRETASLSVPDETSSPCLQSRYHPGGLHPVHFTERYNNGQYRILNKLGFGSSSHVWLAEDTTAAEPLSRPLALKFMEAKASERTLEIEIHKYLTTLAAGEAGSRNILPCLDTFRVEGPNGVHNVIVSDALVFIPALCTWKILEDLDETDIVRQIFQGVSFLHENGVVHRDLHCGNIGIEIPLFRTAGIMDLTENDPPIIFPCILSDAVEHPRSLPKYIVQSSPALAAHRHHYKDASPLVVKIVDFGCAFRPGSSDALPEGKPRRTLTAPEVTYGPWAAPLVEIYSRTSQSLFDGATSSPLGAEMAKLLGPIPEIYRCLLDDNATLHHSDTHMSLPNESEDERFEISTNWKTLETSIVAARAPRRLLSPEDELDRVERDTKDVQRFLSLVKQMLRWNAEDRIQAKEALESPFFTEK